MVARKFPQWLRRPFPAGSVYQTQGVVDGFRLHTVCESALCPNRPECFSERTAAFMILGDICTRRCGFCAISVGRPAEVDPDEPRRVAKAVKQLGLGHVVVTSVARDDLRDEGAGAFYETILAIRELNPEAAVEALVPDFHARRELIEYVCDARPQVFNHNLETVRRLTPMVRRQARYDRSLEVLQIVKQYDDAMTTKSGLMLGLGETVDEVKSTLYDLRAVGVNIVTIGQYLKPKDGKLEVVEFVHPGVFEELGEEGKKIGFSEVYSGPYVRSSYHAGEAYRRSVQRSASIAIKEITGVDASFV